MANITYRPELVGEWARKVLGTFYEDGDSVSVCLKKFGEQLEKLVQPNVWTGSDAKKNYENFVETHTALVKFSNEFGDEFERSMSSINAAIGELQRANLGNAASVSSFGTLTADQLSQLSELNIPTDVINYNSMEIASISGELNNIKTTFENVVSKLNTEIGELDNGSGMWDGDASGVVKEKLLNIIKVNTTKINELLTICINNIKAAGEAAAANLSASNFN